MDPKTRFETHGMVAPETSNWARDRVRLELNLLESQVRITEEEKVAFLSFLEAKGFFLAPCSTEYHLAEEGGLALHTLNVLWAARALRDAFGLFEVRDDSVTICALAHDLCKVEFYTRGKRNKKIDGQWREVTVWEVKDALPLGHGERSLFLAQKFFRLTEREALAIRWHMGAFTGGVAEDYPTRMALSEALKDPLVALIHSADFTATRLLEAEVYQDRPELSVVPQVVPPAAAV